MSLKHADIWRAIDRLAEKNGLSPSGLARKAGLSPTIFNTSKRILGARKRWPSTESIAHILKVTDTTLDAFVALTSPVSEIVRNTLPMISFEEAQMENAFDDVGQPSGNNWHEISFPSILDPKAYTLEITSEQYAPVYRAGDRLIISTNEKPRRNDRIILRTTKDEIVIGTLGRENTKSVEIISLPPAAPSLIFAPGEIEWMRRIVWVSQ